MNAGAGFCSKEVLTLWEFVVANELYLIQAPSQLQVGLVANSVLNREQGLALQTLLDAFTDVFKEPTEFPSQRTCDYAIPLKDSTPISCQSYRYRPVQKTEIEHQIQQMLLSGIIHENSSAFAAPVVLVQKKDNT